MEMKAAVFVLRSGGIPVSLSAAAGSLVSYTASLQEEVGRRRRVQRASTGFAAGVCGTVGRATVVLCDVWLVPAAAMVRETRKTLRGAFMASAGPRSGGVALETRRWLALSDYALLSLALALYATAAAFCAWTDIRRYRSRRTSQRLLYENCGPCRRCDANATHMALCLSIAHAALSPFHHESLVSSPFDGHHASFF